MNREDLPRLSDADREALPDHAVIAGTVQGEPARAIKFTPQQRHGQQHPSLANLLYIDVHVDVGDEYCGLFGGYVTKDVERLVMAAPELLELLEALRRIGNPEFRYSSDDDEDTQLSLRIADARAAITKAMGEQP
jgi:hypothetical protein